MLIDMLLSLAVSFAKEPSLLYLLAAVTSLAKFGAHCDSLCSSILVLLSRLVEIYFESIIRLVMLTKGEDHK